VPQYSALSSILPIDVAVAEQMGTIDGTLFAEEKEALGRVVEKRRAEFAAGRTCARRALEDLGVPCAAILPRPDRRPLWPLGTVGSITHCDGYCAAAAALSREYLSIGIDSEKNCPLPPEVVHSVVRDEEFEWIQTVRLSNVCWDRLLFSAKESVFKAWYPVAQSWLEFDEVHVTFDPDKKSFDAYILGLSPEMARLGFSCLRGRYVVYQGHIVTAIAIAMTPEHAGLGMSCN